MLKDKNGNEGKRIFFLYLLQLPGSGVLGKKLLNALIIIIYMSSKCRFWLIRRRSPGACYSMPV